MTLSEYQRPRDGEVLPPIEVPGQRLPAAATSAIAAAGLVHDLGNLIQIAASAINIVARTPDMPAMHAGPMLDRARNCLEHAGTLVRQNLSRNGDFDDSTADVAACLTEIATLVEAMDRPDLVLAIDVDPDVPDARCDPVELRRAVLNLVFNASDAMAGAGRIAMRARYSREGAIPMIKLEIADHGIGMSPATIARAFDPLFTTKLDGLGGIGLPMVQRFVRNAGGDIAIASEPGTGTVVALRLPAVLSRKTYAEESLP